MKADLTLMSQQILPLLLPIVSFFKRFYLNECPVSYVVLSGY